jgi:hypothetical protein
MKSLRKLVYKCENVVDGLVAVVVKQLVTGLLGVEAGKDAIIRTLIYRVKDELVPSYNYTVAQLFLLINYHLSLAKL